MATLDPLPFLLTEHRTRAPAPSTRSDAIQTTIDKQHHTPSMER